MTSCYVLSMVLKYKHVICMKIRRHSYYQHKYSSKVEELINRQIQAEQQAAQEYLGMAAVFLHPSVSCLGAGGFFMKMYKEELDHMESFIKYQLLRGGTPSIKELKSPIPNKHLKLLDAFNQALCMEKHVTELLEEVACPASDMKGYQCADFITATFLTEQMQAMNEISNRVTQLARLGDNEHAIYHYDLHLAQAYPYKLK